MEQLVPADGGLATPTETPRKMPPHIFWLELSYLIGLAVILVVYEHVDGVRDVLPSMFGPLPIGVVWFGAAGAVLVGLQGVFFHSDRWNPSYNYWHYARPVLGVFSGGVGCLLFLVLIQAGNKQATTPNAVTFDAVAFVLGYADDAVRSLIAGVTDLILQPARRSSRGPAHNPEQDSSGSAQALNDRPPGARR
jgi:hypothetical protein